MNDAKDSKTGGAGMNSSWKRIGIYAGILLGVFLLGLVPMWLTARGRAAERDGARARLRVSQMQNRLATAAIDARRGEYEQARTAASDFFTALRAEVDREQGGALIGQQHNNLPALLSERDEVITLLARGDPAAADRLTNLHVALRQTADLASQP